MAINNKFVHFKTSAKFKEQLEAGNIKDTSVCFIKDTNQIYTHGQYYDCSELTNEKVVGSSLVGYAESQETNEALDLSSSDTIISAFGKLVKAIKDNEEVESAAFVKLRDSIGLDENLNYETGGGSSISEDISDLKNSVGSLNNNSVGKFYHLDDTKTGEIFNDYENNTAGDYSHAEGYKNKVSAIYSHGEGYMNEISSGGAGHVEGRENVVTGLSAHAEGYATKAKGYASHAENGGSTSIYLTGDAGATQYKVVKTHGLLSNLLPSELYEFINFEGFRIVNNDDNFALIDIISSSYDEINDEITITLSNTLSQGSSISNKPFGIVVNIAAGDYSHTEGNCYCNSSKGHAEGLFNVIASNSDASHVEGALNIAKAEQCHVEGAMNAANNNYEHAQGFCNLSNTGDTDDKKTLHSVGIGAKGARKNAHEIMYNGDQYIVGIGGYDGTNPEAAKTIQEVINSSSGSDYVLFNLEDFFTNEGVLGDLEIVIFSNVAERLDSSTTNEINIENVRKLLEAFNNNKIILLKITDGKPQSCIVQCQLSYWNSPFGKQLLLNFGTDIYPSVNDDGSIVAHKISILFRFDRINSLQNEAYYRGISCELNSKSDMNTSVLTGQGFYRYLGEIRLDKYSKTTPYSELSHNDTLQQMIGKLDAKYGNKEDGGTGEIVKTLSPNVFYQFGEVTSLTLTLGNEISGIYNEYMFQFTCGATPATLGLPDDIKWLNGEAPTIEANKTYQVSIVNKLAVIGGF